LQPGAQATVSVGVRGAASDPFLAGTIQRQRAPATSALRQGQGLSPLSRTLFSAGGVLPPLRAHSDGERRSLACCSKLDFLLERSGQVSLEAAEHFPAQSRSQRAARRWCSGSSRNTVRLPSEQAFSSSGIPTYFCSFTHALFKGGTVRTRLARDPLPKAGTARGFRVRVLLAPKSNDRIDPSRSQRRDEAGHEHND